jgi:hypothetical protein
VLDDDEAVFGVMEGGDEEAADKTEDEDVALHDGVMKKYNGGGKEVVSRRDARAPSGSATRTARYLSTFDCRNRLDLDQPARPHQPRDDEETTMFADQGQKPIHQFGV